MLHHAHTRWIAGSTIALTAAISASGQNYTFTRIADSQANPGTFSQPQLSINNLGVVAFRLSFGGGQQSIVTGSGGALKTIITNAGPINNFMIPTVNDVEAVSFSAQLDNQTWAVYMIRDSVLTTIATSTMTNWGFSIYAPMNNAGTVVYLKEPYGAATVYTSAGVGTPLMIANDSVTYSGFLSPHLNDFGIVALHAGLANGQSHFVKGSGGALTLIAGPFTLGNNESPSINCAGQVIYRAPVAGGGFGIYVGDGAGTPQVLASSSGPYSDFFVSSAIRRRGVAFLANLDAGGSGIFTGPDPIAHKVIKTGDALEGSTVTSIVFDRANLNDRGQIAFSANLANGRVVIMRADPVNLPPLCPADIAPVCGDDQVDIDDLLEVVTRWGHTGAGPGGVDRADVNRNGIVDMDDLLEVMAEWGACQ